MIIIDGKEGGGQILRTSLGLSAITGKAVTVENIRANRPNPGLQEQHLQGVLAMQKLCNAELKGAMKGSTKIEFSPNPIVSGQLDVNLSTAGSIGLILQILLIPAIKTDLEIYITGGGTYNKFAPPVHHFEYVLSPLLKKMNYNVYVRIIKNGFYPKGGAKVEVDSKIAELKPLHIPEKGKIISIKGMSIATESLRKAKVAERQAETAQKILDKHFQMPIEIEIKTEYVNALNPGSGIQLWVETEHTIIGGDCVGERGKRAETVAEEAARSLIDSYENGTVDIHTADMLLPYIAIVGGSYKIPKLTNHVKTNIKVIEKFLGKCLRIKDNFVTKTI
jgi:RNA 3'-phosphate cyclase